MCLVSDDASRGFLLDLLHGRVDCPAAALAAKMKAITVKDQGEDLGVNRAVWSVAAALILVRTHPLAYSLALRAAV